MGLLKCKVINHLWKSNWGFYMFAVLVVTYVLLRKWFAFCCWLFRSHRIKKLKKSRLIILYFSSSNFFIPMSLLSLVIYNKLCFVGLENIVNIFHKCCRPCLFYLSTIYIIFLNLFKIIFRINLFMNYKLYLIDSIIRYNSIINQTWRNHNSFSLK